MWMSWCPSHQDSYGQRPVLALCLLFRQDSWPNKATAKVSSISEMIWPGRWLKDMYYKDAPGRALHPFSLDGFVVMADMHWEDMRMSKQESFDKVCKKYEHTHCCLNSFFFPCKWFLLLSIYGPTAISIHFLKTSLYLSTESTHDDSTSTKSDEETRGHITRSKRKRPMK